MKIAITGGTGFVGTALIKFLLKNNHQLYILTRKTLTNLENQQYIQWLSSKNKPEEELNGIDVFINLAGESINSGRWTDARKKSIISSRIMATNEVFRIIESLSVKPKLFINASAIGYYGTSEKETFTESTRFSGVDFLAKTVKSWEESAKKVESLGVRTVFARFGVILDKSEGALPKIAMPYSFFTGGRIGSGKQWISWIHIDDVVQALLYIIEHDKIKGPVNFTAPTPVNMDEFGKTLGDILHRPHWLPVPAFLLTTILGEMSQLVLKGQRVIPSVLVSNGYSFLFPELKDALKNIYFSN